MKNELKEMPLLIAKIEEWSKVRGIDKLPYETQRYKIMEEFGELFWCLLPRKFRVAKKTL